MDGDGFDVRVDNGNTRPLPADGVLDLEGMLPGEHTLELTDVELPCEVTSANPQTATVVAGDVVNVAFTVACEHTGFIQIWTQTTGEDPDPNGYFLAVDGADAPIIEANVVATLAVDAGEHEVTLSEVAANCTVQGEGAAQTVTVAANETAHLTFVVACTAVP